MNLNSEMIKWDSDEIVPYTYDNVDIIYERLNKIEDLSPYVSEQIVISEEPIYSTLADDLPATKPTYEARGGLDTVLMDSESLGETIYPARMSSLREFSNIYQE